MQTRLTSELQESVIQKVKDTVDKINAHYHLDMKVPPVFYDVTGTTAGLAKYRSMSIHFNSVLFLQNIEDTINNTVPHEVCHLGVLLKHLKDRRPGAPKPHGAEWKLMMWVVGAAAKRTHDYDVEDVKTNVTEYQYQCGCAEGIKVGKVIHQKILRGNRYNCRRCNQTIHSGERIIKLGFSRPSPNGTTAVRETEEE